MKGWDQSHIKELIAKGLVCDDEPNYGISTKKKKNNSQKSIKIIHKGDYVIGIDPGVNTGIAIWNGKILIQVLSMTIHEALDKVHNWIGMIKLVRLEDARKRNWFGESGREQLQGAGSIKRDCKIWEDFLSDHKIPFELVAPRNNKTKVDAALFKKITGWKESTNEHGRDAAMLVYGFNCKDKLVIK